MWTNLESCKMILGRMIPDFEVLESTIASALKKLLTADFKRRLYMEQQEAKQNRRFLKGRQIAHVIHDHFKISGTGDALLDVNGRLRVPVEE